MNAVAVLEDVLKEQGLTWGPREKAIIAEIMTESTALAVDAANGVPNLAGEWAQIETQVKQIAAIAELRVTSVLPIALRRFAAIALGLLLGKLGLPVV